MYFIVNLKEIVEACNKMEHEYLNTKSNQYLRNINESGILPSPYNFVGERAVACELVGEEDRAKQAQRERARIELRALIKQNRGA